MQGGFKVRFLATVDTDIGISKKVNQDSALIKHGMADDKEILMAIICDGMGGLARGELASATVIRAFSKWFDEELGYELENIDMSVIGAGWSLMLRDLNSKIADFSISKDIGSMGTTFTGVLFVDDQYVVVHVGDSRLYHIGETVTQITRDHSFVAREVELGNMTAEQAKIDRRRNLLLQCVGASGEIEPQVVYGEVAEGVYMLCSDGFHHETNDAEMRALLGPGRLTNREIMHDAVSQMIEQIMRRGERDNISCLLVRAAKGSEID